MKPLPNGPPLRLDRWMFDRQVRYVRRMHPRKNYARFGGPMETG